MKNYEFSLSNIPGNVEHLKFEARRNAPIIMTIGGAIGLIVTSISAYKAAKRVGKIVEEAEASHATASPMPAGVVALRVGAAVAPTVVIGATSVAMILGSYHVLNNRNTILSSAIASLAAENRRMRSTIREQYPDAVLAPNEGIAQVTDADGVEQSVASIDPDSVPYMEGLYFSRSSEMTKDDHEYNMTWIAYRGRMLDNKLQETGHLTLNDVYDALGVELTDFQRRQGAVLGWTNAFVWELETEVVQVMDEEGLYSHPEIYVTWPALTSIYDKTNYAQDLSNYNY